MSLPFSTCVQFLCSLSTSSVTCPLVSFVDVTRDILRNMNLIALLITISPRAHNFSLFLVLEIFLSPYLILLHFIHFAVNLVLRAHYVHHFN